MAVWRLGGGGAAADAGRRWCASEWEGEGSGGEEEPVGEEDKVGKK